ncbi:pancreatic triacylglycerol lipase-like [Leptidea sinapis]|uniref:pancreatic triacylglycerol lipase-like n=1 Tax=Leptidea sinapis TaxID=189913 RepID=UPI002143C7AC|nr:pancreatic triacylglycerol lipase-like [Leptidea sinapis]
MLKFVLIISFYSALCSAVPTNPIISKVEPGLRYQYAQDSDGNNHLVDLWMSINDLSEAARFFPEVSNVYHLFTRSNPTRSQPLLLNNVNMLQESNFDGSRRTIVLIHGWMNSGTSDFNMALIPVLLAAENVNVIVVDWSSGANSLNYRIVNWNSVTSGEAVAKFINFVNQWTGSNLSQYHIIGHGVGGHKAGVVGRNLNGQIGYITGLNPALIGWVNNIDRLSPSDSLYTEVIHTNYLTGYVEELGHVDFYPNGGISMPGCDSNECDHARSFFYFAESVTSGGFTGRECLNYYAAVLRMCDFLSGRLQMGGLTPKYGKTGVYYLETNGARPFSQG